MSDLVNVPRTPSPAAKTPRTPISPPSSGRPLSRTGRYLPEPYTSEERQKRIDAVVDREKEAQAREDELRSEISLLIDANAELSQNVAELEGKVQGAQCLHEELQGQVDDKDKLLQDQEKTAEDALEELRRELSNLLEEKAKELDKEQAKVRNLEDNVAGMQAKHELERSSNAEQVEKYRQEVERLEAKARGAEAEKSSADHELKKAESKYQEDLVKLKQQISNQNAELKTLQKFNSDWKAKYYDKLRQHGEALANFEEAERCRGLERKETARLDGLLDDRNERITTLEKDLSRAKTERARKAAEAKKAREDVVKLKETANEDRQNATKRLEAQKAAEKRADDLEAELQQALEKNRMSTEATATLEAAEQEASDTKRKLQAAESKILELEQEAEARDKEDIELFELQQARHLGRERRKRERSGGSERDNEQEAKRLRPSPENWNPEDDPSF